MLHAGLILLVSISFTNADYWSERTDFLKLEDSEMLGSSIVLNDKEIRANEILMAHKFEEYDAGFENPRKFAPGRHFFDIKTEVERSEVFKIIQRMPKGAALHGHDIALVSEDYLFSLTYEKNVYICTTSEGKLLLKILDDPRTDNTCDWSLVESHRVQNGPAYDSWLRSQLTLNIPNRSIQYVDINDVWKAFVNIFAAISPMVTYRPIMEKYFYQALQELYDDNVMYLEFRTTLQNHYELNGTIYGPIKVVGFYKEVTERFKREHSEFVGARVIYGPSRNVDGKTLKQYLQTLQELQTTYGDFVAGFDLVGQEDLGKPLSDFIDDLLPVSESTNFYFHAGETNWYGTDSDTNLIDAVLLGTKRIGHGYGIIKHPGVLKSVKQKDIAIEVCPISNQVLMLLQDLRNHPANFLIGNGYPVVISYDDPSFWSTKGLSYDFYMAFMGMASRNADLKLLKQLALNSLKYSSLDGTDYDKALMLWTNKWNEFVDLVIVNGSDKINRLVNFKVLLVATLMVFTVR